MRLAEKGGISMNYHVCCVVPPHILRHLAEHSEHRDRALRTLATTERLRGRREVLAVRRDAAALVTVRPANAGAECQR